MQSSSRPPNLIEQLQAIQHGLIQAQELLQLSPASVALQQQVFPMVRELVFALLRVSDTLRARIALGSIGIDLAMAVLLRDTCRALARLLEALVDAEWTLALVVHTTALVSYAEDMYRIALRASSPAAAPVPARVRLQIVK